MRSHDIKLNRARNTWPKAIPLVAILFLRAGTGVVGIAGVVGLVLVCFHAEAPGLEDPPSSGIVVRTEVTALWIPKALRDVAQGEAGGCVFRPLDALQTELKRRGLNAAWYALTYRGYQVNGESAEITQVRCMSGMPDHFEEFQDVLATAAGNRARSEARDFSRATIHVIPDSLLNADPLKAITELMAPGVVRRKSPHAAVP